MACQNFIFRIKNRLIWRLIFNNTVYLYWKQLLQLRNLLRINFFNDFEDHTKSNKSSSSIGPWGMVRYRIWGIGFHIHIIVSRSHPFWMKSASKKWPPPFHTKMSGAVILTEKFTNHIKTPNQPPRTLTTWSYIIPIDNSWVISTPTHVLGVAEKTWKRKKRKKKKKTFFEAKK